MVCLLAAPWVQLSVSADNGWPHNALRHHMLMPIRCHFRDCKALLVTSLTHVSGAIASVQTFNFTLSLQLSSFSLNYRLLCNTRFTYRMLTAHKKHQIELTAARQLYCQVAVDNDATTQLMCIRHTDDVSAWTHWQTPSIIYSASSYMYIIILVYFC